MTNHSHLATLGLIAMFWYSSNPAVVSVDPQTGLFNYVHAGKTEICAQYGSLTQCIDVEFK